ncbi:unnamed protein product [Gongylonema pulchrum]|uniref:Adenosine 3'-phospho 5'-phosphosulfate transporter 1 n=1 Tax=Gongylonema pulchrum TaxID=637853 RepID=A0A183EX62_9BILA|nr:unnamed protein product [Gongylonema pulchrum]
MGFIVRGERYGRDECACAVVLALGASLFLLSNNTKGFAVDDRVTTLSGICLMSGYLLFDAFTLNWQKTLFDCKPRISKYQVVIYATIERFGPVIFAVMMTLRQIFSIMLSTVAYGHPISALSVLGFFITFSAIFINIYRRHRVVQNRHQLDT